MACSQFVHICGRNEGFSRFPLRPIITDFFLPYKHNFPLHTLPVCTYNFTRSTSPFFLRTAINSGVTVNTSSPLFIIPILIKKSPPYLLSHVFCFDSYGSCTCDCRLLHQNSGVSRKEISQTGQKQLLMQSQSPLRSQQPEEQALPPPLQSLFLLFRPLPLPRRRRQFLRELQMRWWLR